ncbi:mucin-17-like [Liolophura sinensis]|uniref:mucin-17-like n=1 Tax=Liolophura sinensis TaxID=3198878 RepID=UPI0031589258
MDCERKLTIAYQDIPGFIKVTILDVRRKSVICPHEVKFDAIEVQRDGNMADVTRIIEHEVLKKALPYLRNVTIANCTVNETNFKNILQEASERATDDPCSVVELDCLPGFNCNSSDNAKLVCLSDCETETGRKKCGSHGTCTLSSNGNMTCVCTETPNEIYSGHDCSIRMEKFRLEKNKIIAIGVGAGGGVLLVLIIIIIILIRKLRKSKNRRRFNLRGFEEVENFSSRELTSIRVSDLELRDSARKNTNPGRTAINGRYNAACINKLYSGEYGATVDSRWNVHTPSPHSFDDDQSLDEARLEQNLRTLQPIGKCIIERPKFSFQI